MTTHACSTCAHYDPILKGQKPTTQGWCVKKSLYPAVDSPGQVTPPGARRVAAGTDLAEPYIVAATAVKPGCMDHTPKPVPKTKDELRRLAHQNGAKR